MLMLKTKNLTETVTMKNLPTLRLTFFIASLLIVAAVILAKEVHPDWIYLALLPAFGLMLSALTGFCPMVFFLQLFTGNRNTEA